ncbi:hypothetical protein SAY87_005444 [Trapa incisa]|uniref:apyrase n=1 Tax=Trapa incisa TaxID=236973 RepID=A0AAN7KA77_9MYRT|nr:hypothetical protein SAY87_005444 [Trapa incisa]
MDYFSLQPRSSPATYFPPHRTQLHPRMHPFSPPSNPNPKKSSSKVLLLLVPVFTVPFLFFLFSTGRSVHWSSKFADPKFTFFGAAINVGLYASRIRVFEFVNEGDLLTVAFDGSMKVGSGLAEFGSEPEEAGRVISEMVEFAKWKVPEKERSSTRVVLLVNGGLERLILDQRDGILELFRQILRKSTFQFRDEWVREIQGEDEGVYAWVAVNYVLGSLRGELQDTTGVIELGGGSLQVAYAMKDAISVQPSRVIRIFGTVYNLYTHGFPQLGQDAAWKSLNELHKSKDLTSSLEFEGHTDNPCVSRGYEPPGARAAKFVESNLAGNLSACEAETSTLLKARNDECLQTSCKVLQPSSLKIEDNAVSLESFFYTSEIFGMFPRSGLSYMWTARQHYCEDNWDELKNQYKVVDDRDLCRYCFSSVYMTTLVNEGLGISTTSEGVIQPNRTGIIPLYWSLGAYIVQTMGEPVYTEPDNFGQIVGNGSVTYFSLFAVLLILILAMVLVVQWWKPRFMTIYDLEKGRYIVTRIPR